MTEKLTAYQAILLDKIGVFYYDWDEEIQMYGIFGSESGFCYHTFTNLEEAKTETKRMNR